MGYKGAQEPQIPGKRGKIIPPKPGFTRENQRQVSRLSSVDSYIGEQNRDSGGKYPGS